MAANFVEVKIANMTDAALAAPGADRLVFWDDSAGRFTHLTPGTGLSITGTTLTASGGGSGTVTSASVVSANGFGGSVATATTTPAITLTTSVTGILKGNGTAVSAAAQGTDYYQPGGTATAGKLLGDSGSGVLGNVTVGTGLSLAAGTLTASGGGGLTVGSAITSGTNNRILYQNASGNLAESLNLQYDGNGFALTCTPGYSLAVTGLTQLYGNYSNNTYATLDVDNYSFAATNSYCLSLLGAPSTPTPLARLRGMSSTTTKRDLGYLDAGFSVATDASYKGFVRLMAQDFNAVAGGREGVRVGTDGTQALVGFFGHAPAAKAATPTTLADVIAILQNLGLCS